MSYTFYCFTCEKTHYRRAYCNLRYHKDRTCFKSRKRRILQRLGISNVLCCAKCKSFDLDFSEEVIVCKNCGEIYTGKNRLFKLKWRKKYSNYRLFFGKTCKFLTITSDKVLLYQLNKKRSEFVKQLRYFLYYLRHPNKLPKCKKEELDEKGHKRFRRGYNLYSVGVIDQSFKKRGGELKIENGIPYCNLHSHMAISEKGSDKYPISRELLIDLWKVLFNEKPFNLYIRRENTDKVFEYLAKRAAGRLGDTEKNNIHFLSDILSPREYDIYFRNRRIFRAYGIQKKLVCDKCGKVYNQNVSYSFCPFCGGMLELCLIGWNYNGKNLAKRVLYILKGNNCQNICPYCGSPHIELIGITEDEMYKYGKPPPEPTDKRTFKQFVLANQINYLRQELEKNKSLDYSYLKKHYSKKLIQSLLKKGLLIRSGSKVFLN